MLGDNEDTLCKDCKKKYLMNFKCETKNDLNILWLPENFSQSRFTKSSKASNACTLIVLLMCKRIERLDCRQLDTCFKEDFNIHSELIYVLAESILQGNLLHDRLLAHKPVRHMNLSIPEAIKAGGRELKSIKEWNSFIYLQDLTSSLYTELKEKLTQCLTSIPDRTIYVILIALNRSILLVIEHQGQGRITLLDSHQHAPYGSVIVQTPAPNLQALCSWYCALLRHKCSMYELSFMYFPSAP
ncbi:hypothetical protein M8J76_007970 [Diaphorina citri]|nr:hypothetical protein M8J76_007970 [Diaphorina citri]